MPSASALQNCKDDPGNAEHWPDLVTEKYSVERDTSRWCADGDFRWRSPGWRCQSLAAGSSKPYLSSVTCADSGADYQYDARRALAPAESGKNELAFRIYRTDFQHFGIVVALMTPMSSKVNALNNSVISINSIGASVVVARSNCKRRRRSKRADLSAIEGSPSIRTKRRVRSPSSRMAPVVRCSLIVASNYPRTPSMWRRLTGGAVVGEIRRDGSPGCPRMHA